MTAENTFTDYKITAFSEIAEQVRNWRKAGRSLVFTNGCFDLLHAGTSGICRLQPHLLISSSWG